jgi:hypothetical protein
MILNNRTKNDHWCGYCRSGNNRWLKLTFFSY